MNKFIILILFLTLQLFAAGTYSQMAAQSVSVSGTVVDNTNDQLPGVNVTVKGTTTGVTTDANGRYTLTVPGRDAVLVFSYVGFNSQEIRVGDRNVIDVTLVESAELLDEVIVVGYGTVRKSDLTGSVVSISSDKFKNLPQGGATQILQGKAAGVNITSTSGSGDTNIRIRGTTSINKSSEPLWVVDGVIGGQQGNFYDIESIEVLKDASSTAIYGSQGANGVIVVTTKKAQEGKARITFDTRFNWNTIRKKPELLNAYEFADAYRYVNGVNAIPDADFEAYRNGTKGIDWLDTMTQTGFGQSYNLNVSGGSAKTKYGISTSVSDSKSQIVTVTSRGINIKASLDTEIAPWLNFSGYVYGSRRKEHNGTGQAEFSSILEFSPCMEMMDANGVYNPDPYSSLSRNPMAGKIAQPRDYWRNSLSVFGDLRFKLPVDGLTLSVQGLYITNNNIDREVDYTYRGPNELNWARHYWTENMRWRNINNLTYQKEFGDHRLTVTAVQELTKYTYSNVTAETRQFDNEDYLGYWALGQGTQTTGQDYSNSAMVSYIGRLIYSYQGKYSLTGTYRADAASQFVDKYKWGYFPSVGVAWNIAEEDFFNKDLIQQLKLRASAGISGNHGVGAYSTLATMSKDDASFGTTTRYYGFWPREFNNTNLRWEKTVQYNVGLDISLLDQRLSIITDVFDKEISDLLFRKTLPAYNGKSTIWTNEGSLSNKGWELTINAWPVRTRNFIWESNLTASYVKNEVKDLAGVDFIIPDSSRGGANSGGLFALQVGKPVGTFYLQEFAGFDEYGRTLHYVQGENGRTGDVTYQNQNINKKILDQPSIPLWNYGWNNSITYKNWDLNVFFRATGKYYRLNQARFYQSCMIGAKRFISSREGYYLAWDRVADKSKAEFASLTNPDRQYVPASTQWLENAMHLRCQNLTLGYQIPKDLTRFADVHLSFSIQNLFVLTKYKGLDPETVSEKSTSSTDGYFDTTFGYDTGSFPLPRTFNFIARFNF